MLARNSIVLACAIALSAGCANNKNTKRASTQPSQTLTATADAATAEGATVAASQGVAANFAGAWNLAIPRQDQQKATITATDGTHVTISAGENLSGNYVVQGSYLLILTRDEKLQPLAWRINSPDSLTVVRSADGDTNYTGVTLVRAATPAVAADDSAQPTDAPTDAQVETDASEAFEQ